MKRKTILLAIILALGTYAMTQNALYMLPEITTKVSLIREYEPGIDVVYNNNGSLQSFLYIDRIGGLALEAQSPYPIQVTDMEIYNETLYFCGHLTGSTNTNFVGFFDINDLFFGSHQATILPVLYNPVDTVNGIPIQGGFVLSKLEVYKVPGLSIDETHIYMIGDVTFNSSETTDYSCLLDMMYLGASWTYDMAYEPDRVYYFNDLTVTDSFLVVVGNKHGGEGEYLHGYYLPPFASQHTLNNTLYVGGGLNIQYWFTNSWEYHPISKPLIETLTGDAFATACYGKWQDNPGVIVSWYSTYGTIVKRYFVPNITGTSEFKDLKYNDISDNLYLMPDHQNSVAIDEFYGFKLGAGTCNVYHSALQEQHSLDRFVGGLDVLSSGSLDYHLAILKYETTEFDCVKSVELPVTESKEPPHCAVFVHDITPSMVNPIYISPTIKEFNLEKFCGDETFKQQQ